MSALPYRSKEILSCLFTHSWWQPLYLQITTVHLKYCPIFNMLANNNNKTDYCIITIRKSIDGEKRTKGLLEMAIVLNERCFNGALRISSTRSSNIKMHESWQTSLLTEQEIPAFFVFCFVLFPTNVKSPVQDDIPREVKFVNVLYYRKCCTDIPSHFLLRWLICNNIDNKSWGLLGRPHF